MLNSLLRGRLGANIDLRSPSANIDRTPIVLGAKVEPEAKVVLEDVVDNISCITLEPKRLLNDTDEKSLCSANESRKSYLETNLDCIETDLDAVPKLKKSIFNTPHLKSDLFDPRSPSTEFCRTPILQNDDSAEFLTPVHETNKVTIVNEIEKTPLESDNFIDCLSPEDLSKSPGEDNILNISTSDVENKIVIKSTKLDEIKKDFAKKYGKNINRVNQVYEDKEFYKVTPRKALSSSGRTPLSCVRNKLTHLRSKSDTQQEQKTKVALTNPRTPLSCLRNVDTHLTMVNDLSAKQKSPKKVVKGVSRIPTFRPKAMNADVENLDSMRCDVWDKDTSVVI